MKVIIAGSTGMIGSLVLKECLANPKIEKIITIDRREGTTKHAKITEVVHDDFLDYSKIEKHFKDIDAVYYCVGVYTGAVPKDEFRKITVDYTRAFAEVLKKHSPQANFCFLSGSGADREEKSKIMFCRDKGAAENIIDSINFKGSYFFRPSYIYPVKPRKEPNFSYVLMRKTYPIFKYLFPTVKSTQVASAMVKVGIKGADKQEIENKDIKKLSR